MSEGAAKRWMAARGWQPFAFQQQVWQAMAEGRSGLLHATTGAGKTYAVWLGALERFSALAPVDIAQAAPKKEANKPPPLTVLWITPMRALAADSLRALQEPLPDLAPHWTSGLRTGDTASGERAAQDRRLPTVLVTTPESVSLLLARADAHERLASVQLVVVDEWHELVGNKRGVQVQLALARLSGWNPRLQVWGMSATLGNLPEALATLVPALPPRAPRRAKPLLVQGRIDKALQVQVLLPERVERFAWAGHMGLSLLPQVVQSIEANASTLVLQHPSDAEDGTPPPAHGARRSPPPIPQVLARTATPRGGAMASGNRHARGGATLLFTNTRSQAERWYQALLEARPDWAGTIALHHGSLSGEVRGWVEAGLKAGTLKAVVCTSSLDLGVDFLPVEQVLQIGSAKGVARLVQRAGRSGHAPGRTSSITLVPTHSLELWKPPQPARRWPKAALKTGTRPARRWTCWYSTWSPLPWVAALCPMRCWPRCAVPRPTPHWPTTTGNGRCSLCARAAHRWPTTRTFIGWCRMRTVCGACPMRGWRGGIAATSAPS